MVVDMQGAGNGHACLWPTSQQNAFCTQCRPQGMGEQTTFCLRRTVSKKIHLCETYILYISISFDIKHHKICSLLVCGSVEKHLAGMATTPSPEVSVCSLPFRNLSPSPCHLQWQLQGRSDW